MAVSDRLKLRWESFRDESELALLGGVQIAMITPLAGQPGRWAYSVTGISVKWITKGFGHVNGKAAARGAVERAWMAWLERAELS